MDDVPELTPRESFQASLYKDPNALFRRAVIRMLWYLVPSLGLMIAWFINGDPAYAIIGYGILLHQTLYRLYLTKKGAQTTGSIIKKYETKRGDKPDDT